MPERFWICDRCGNRFKTLAEAVECERSDQLPDARSALMLGLVFGGAASAGLLAGWLHAFAGLVAVLLAGVLWLHGDGFERVLSCVFMVAVVAGQAVGLAGWP